MIYKNKLVELQSMDLDFKIRYAQEKIQDFYHHFDGQVYVSFSGGKDSTVLLNLVREIYKEVPAVFVDTGLEYPEIREFVRSIENVIWIKPEMNFKNVLNKYGFPIVSKKVARMLRTLQNPTKKNKNITKCYLEGITSKGKISKSFKIPEKWKRLIKVNFKISEECCDVIKKRPFNKYHKDSNRFAIIGNMADDSDNRHAIFVQQGCNVYTGKFIHSKPLSIWFEKDVWQYLKENNIKYSKIYDMGYKRTGCMFCMFGLHMEKGENRFDRMQKTHPKQYKYCMENLGLREVIEVYLNG